MCGWPRTVLRSTLMAKGKKTKVAPGDVASNRYASYKYDLPGQGSSAASCCSAPRSSRCATAGRRSRRATRSSATTRSTSSASTSRRTRPASRNNHDPDRDRKLLLSRRQIDKLKAQTKEKGLTLVPTRMYFSKGRAKVEIAVAKGKNQFDKREAIKTREMKRDLSRALSDANR